ncbi:MAG: zinc-dependent alcohol dehydrogenase [Pikeienuella sp.]
MNRVNTPPSGLWHVGPRQCEQRVSNSGDGDIRVDTICSLISRGTERLIAEGRVPEAEHERMRAPHQEGDFPYPVKYGYAAVGRIEGGSRVFALYPHQDWFALSAPDLIAVPDAIPSHRAALAANMETALNALWDGGAGPGDRIAVVGGGLVGCLVARLASRLPGTEVTLVDVATERESIAHGLGVNFALPDQAPVNCDLVFHTSATAPGLSTALGLLGDEAALVEMSWYGDKVVSVPLGSAFHAGRQRIISSQVGKVSQSRRPRWSYQRRLSKAMALLDDVALDCLIGNQVAFADLPTEMPNILAPDAPGIATIVTY